MKLDHIEADPDFRACIEECERLLARKGHDYTQGAQGDRGRLKNFYKTGERNGITPFQALNVYMGKHLDAIDTFVKVGQLESEPIEGRIHDAINYLMLLYKLVQVEKRAQHGGELVPDHAPGGGE